MKLSIMKKVTNKLLTKKQFYLVFEDYTEFGHSKEEMDSFYEFYLHGYNHGFHQMIRGRVIE